MRLVSTLALGVTLACASSTPRPTPPASEAQGTSDAAAMAAAASIRPEAIAAHIRFLADDLLAGRFPGTPGYDVAARYVASELQALGLEPAGENGTYFQKVPLVAAKLEGGSLEFSGGSGAAIAPTIGEDLLLAKDLDTGRTDVNGEVVFAGYGLSVPEYGYDDFAQVDVRNKIVVVLAGAPLSDRPDFFPSLASAVHGQSERVERDLMRRGARAAIGVWTPAREALTPFRHFAKYFGFESMRLEDSPPLLPAAVISGATFDALLKKAGRSGDDGEPGGGLGAGKATRLRAGPDRAAPRGDQDPAAQLGERRSVSCPATPSRPPARRWSSTARTWTTWGSGSR